MDELKRSVDYSRKRLQAIRNCESHISDILWKTTQKVITASKRYRGAGRLTNESALLSYAKNVTAEAEESINSYISAYSKVSCKILGIDSENIESFLVSDIYGKTTSERNAVYLGNFAEDIVRMIKAGTLMGYSDQQLLSSIRTGYKDPYHTSVITKAKRKDINIDVPSYGKGYYKNAYQNIVRNASQVIALAWGQAAYIALLHLPYHRMFHRYCFPPHDEDPHFLRYQRSDDGSEYDRHVGRREQDDALYRHRPRGIRQL